MILTVAPNGRIVIPAAMRAELGLAGNQKVIARIVDGALVIETVEVAVKRAQALLAPYLAGTPSMADELIAERRREADGE
jgi:AbrB family looped-hinge helix DNA binding protein